jgi:hypothetical protein
VMAANAPKSVFPPTRVLPRSAPSASSLTSG